MARLLADACFPRPAVFKLRRLGHDVEILQVIEGTSRPETPLPDEEVLELATSLRRAILTLNTKHFEALHDAYPGHKGIIVCDNRADLDFAKQAKDIDSRLKEHKRLAGKLIRVPAAEAGS